MTHGERSRHPWLLLLAVATFAASGCGEKQPDAYGNFEATEVAVSSQVGGPLLRFEVEEGESLEENQFVALVDTLSLSLQREELRQRRVAAERGVEAARAQMRVLQAQLGTAREDLARAERLYAGEAATAADLTRLRGQVDALLPRVEAARAQIEVAQQEARSVDARLDQIDDQIRRAIVRNPRRGTVLTTFAERGEFVQPGRALYTVADLDTLELRAYVSGGQLSALRLGASVHVTFDGPDGGLATREGRLSWIASQAEFTPTPIQTREERVDQVYAVKVKVPNRDGALKVGMPGELVLRSDPDPDGAR